jgi:hypothetical protein
VVSHFGGLSKVVCVYHQAQKVKVFQRNFLGSKLVSSYGNSSSSMLLLENGQHLLRSFGALSRWQKHRPVAVTARRKQDDGQSRYTPPVKERKSDSCRQKLLQKAFESATSTILATGAAAAILLQTCSSAAAESLTVTFPGSSIGEVNNVQRTLVEAWGIVRETYVDPTFNNQGSTTFVPKICCQILFVSPRASCLCCLDRVKDTCANTSFFLCSNSNTFFFMGSILKQIGISSWKRYWERLCH